MREAVKQFWRDESGMGTVEIILIIVVLIGLVIVFKKQINDLVTKIFKKITTDSNKIIGSAGLTEMLCFDHEISHVHTPGV